MNKFSKEELKATILIFLILLSVSIPNFISSIRRSRDQNRRDDIGGIVHGLDDYYADFGVFPKSSPDGMLVACKNPGDKVEVDSKGRLVVNLTPCVWGRDSLVDLTPGSNKVYIKNLPLDPKSQNGDKYIYISDGYRYQVFASLESKDEAGYDPSIFARKIMCGTRICNLGSSYGVPVNISIQDYIKEKNK